MLSRYQVKIRPLFLGILLLLFCGTVKAQITQSHYFAIPNYKRVPNSLYNKIVLVDMRIDTATLGIVKTGDFNESTVVIAKRPIAGQVQFNFASQIDNSAKPNELLLLLKELNFAELTTGMKEEGFFRMRADLFAKTGEGFQRVSRIDTIARVTGLDVTHGLLKKGSEVFSHFIGASLTSPGLAGNVFTINDIAKADSIEKSRIKVFTADTLVNGYYANFKSFKDQIPTGEIFVKDDDMATSYVKIYNAEGKLKLIKPGQAYAVVHKGVAYIVTPTGYNQITKVGADLIFVSQTGGSTTSPVYYGAGGAVGGALAGLLTVAMTPKARQYKTKIDHLNGSFTTFAEVNEKNK